MTLIGIWLLSLQACAMLLELRTKGKGTGELSIEDSVNCLSSIQAPEIGILSLISSSLSSYLKAQIEELGTKKGEINALHFIRIYFLEI